MTHTAASIRTNEVDGVTVRSGVVADENATKILVVNHIEVTPPASGSPIAAGLIRTAWPLVLVAGALLLMGYMGRYWLFGYWIGEEQTAQRLFCNLTMILGFALVIGAGICETIKRGGISLPVSTPPALPAPRKSPALAAPARRVPQNVRALSMPAPIAR